MCQCGCSDFGTDRAFAVRGCIVNYNLYSGCQECHEGIGVDLHFFPPKNEWVNRKDAERVVPDEYGCNDGRGYQIPIFEVKDLRSAAAELITESGEIGNNYATLDDWLSDYGLQLIQDAIRLNYKRNKAGKEAHDA